MARVNTAGIGALCVSLLSTTAAFADVTPEQVWDAWQKGYEAYGYQVLSGSTDRQGDTLNVSDVKLVNEVNDSSFTMTIPEIKLRDRGDGTVEATLADKMTAEATADLPKKDPMQMSMVMTQKGTSVIVSGSPEDMIYDITAPNMTIEVDQKIGKEGATMPVKVWASIDNTTGRYEMKQGDSHDVTSQVKSAMVKFTASGADPESSGTFNMSGQLADLDYSGNFILPNGAAMEKLDEALSAGMNLDFKASYGPSNYELTADSKEGPVTIKSSADTGTIDVKMAKDGIHYAATGTKAKIDMTSQKLPFPVSAALDEMDADFTIPVTSSTDTQPYKAKIALKGLTLSDNVWSLFDPQGKLPRDPASLVIDLSGNTTVTSDLFSPEAANMPAPPLKVDSADVNALQLTVAGADLRGTGALKFDNSGPVPKPVGTLDFTLKGANALMDNLVAAGLVPQDQVMFGRMMLGLYAKPTGDDEMQSQVEFKDGGEILVNGQRVQ
ncbi:DUF2125 domain-containing protein [Thioclava sp. 15-R06ZXC-3]|uniref:DUF2125 domain-containing protein n=1 Tax=Thioclava arctica TaxID=3238301 RepID=A0ABV3TIA8_9RHOB